MTPIDDRGDDSAREHTRPLRDYAGETKPDRPLLIRGPLGPWNGTVRVTRVKVRGYAGDRFGVDVQWTGPPPIGNPPSDQPVSATDMIVLEDGELARRVALEATDALRDGRLPDLRASVARLRERAAIATK